MTGNHIFFSVRSLIIKNTDENCKEVEILLESDTFEDFYQVFSMKPHKGLHGIPNLKPDQLVRTNWFRTKIKEIIS